MGLLQHESGIKNYKICIAKGANDLINDDLLGFNILLDMQFDMALNNHDIHDTPVRIVNFNDKQVKFLPPHYQ